ncbi:MAG: hypothetical protein WD904_00080 [Dehalococcoidia bacterium]
MRNATYERPASQGPQVLQQRLAPINVLAAFDDLSAARHAIEALGRAGFDGETTSLHGPGPDLAAEMVETSRADARLMGRWAGLVGAWAAIGTVAGFVLGTVVAALVIGIFIDRDVTVGNTLGAGALMALAVGIIVGLVAMFWPIQASDTWELTFHEEYPGQSVVGVHTRSVPEALRARDVLRDANAIEVRVSGRGGGVRDAAYRMTTRS